MEDQNSQLVNVVPETPSPEYVIDDVNNPNAVIHLVVNMPNLYEAVLRVIKENKEMLALDEGSLKDLCNPTVTLSRIRFAFWAEYENAITTGRKMKGTQIYGGLCTEYYFIERILADNKKVAFILCPPANYLAQVKEALQTGMENLRRIVDSKIIDDDGYLIPRAADVVLKAVLALDMRVKGAIVQKVDQRTLSYNLNKDLAPNQALVLPTNLDELDSKLAELREQIQSSKVRPPQSEDFIDVTVPAIDVKGAGPGSYVVKK